MRDPSPPLDRRSFLRGAVLLVCAPPVFAACEGDAVTPAPDAAAPMTMWPVPEGAVLSPARYATLSALMDALIPGSDMVAGAHRAHAAWYVDQLLGAFRTDPPRIYAGGPYSGRHGGRDSFSEFQPLTRVEELRWRTWIEGSRGLPEREWNGPVVGLVTRYERGLDALDATARESSGMPFAALDLLSRRGLVGGADAAFVALAYEHAVEGTYGDPVYGGNFEALGWAAIDYEGDRQPVGYTARQMTHPEEG
ncbi:MAG: gluconate 2-dehydrogenase subunit 3 family protein [Polyangiales bacterium]